ncbi:hypothetical protein os1_24060 [Comamonadaceae bacterium OS-1]|nr:hypothetical protein os1_24060 [Comamonadaceae bacterium OS-1]
MLSRYSDQAAARKDYALIGTLLLVFGVAIAIFEATFMAVVGVGFAFAVLLPAVFFSHTAFATTERLLGQIFA